MKRKIIGLTTSAVLGSTMITTIASADSIKVKSGDTLWSLSQKYNTSVSSLKSVNGLTTDFLYVGQVLQIPGQNNNETTTSTVKQETPTETTSTNKTYTVKKGDSLWLIANKHSVSVQQLKEWNALSSDVIYPGQTLKLNKTEGQTPAESSQSNTTENKQSSNKEVSNTYTVKQGDSLWKIASSLNVSVQQLKSMNQLSSDTIYPGQVLKVTTTVVESPTPSEKQTQTEQQTDTITNGKVLLMINEAKKLTGTPYKWGGNTPSGFDCSGFIYYVMNKVTSISRLSTAGYWNVMTEVKEPSVGDFVYFETYKEGPSHMGIYLGNQQFIHASSSGVMISSLTNSYWKERYLGAKRYFQ